RECFSLPQPSAVHVPIRLLVQSNDPLGNCHRAGVDPPDRLHAMGKRGVRHGAHLPWRLALHPALLRSDGGVGRGQEVGNAKICGWTAVLMERQGRMEDEERSFSTTGARRWIMPALPASLGCRASWRAPLSLSEKRSSPSTTWMLRSPLAMRSV